MLTPDKMLLVIMDWLVWTIRKTSITAIMICTISAKICWTRADIFDIRRSKHGSAFARKPTAPPKKAMATIKYRINSSDQAQDSPKKYRRMISINDTVSMTAEAVARNTLITAVIPFIIASKYFTRCPPIKCNSLDEYTQRRAAVTSDC